MVDNLRFSFSFRKLKNSETKLILYNGKKTYYKYNVKNENIGINKSYEEIVKIINKKLQYYLNKNYIFKVSVEDVAYSPVYLKTMRFELCNNEELIKFFKEMLKSFINLINDRDCSTIKFIFNIKRNK